jgi:PAS domain S-box-containing protein
MNDSAKINIKEDQRKHGEESLKMGQEALRKSVARYRRLVQETGQVVFDHDLATGRIDWEGAMDEVLGYTWEEMQQIGASEWKQLVHPEDRAQMLAQLDLAITGGHRYRVEYRLRRKDGLYITVDECGSFLRDDPGQALRMLGTIRDITARKKMEAQLLRSQRMESIGTLASGIAHDLNNVLAPISMACQLFASYDMEGERKQWLEIIHRSAQRGADLVKQVLSFCRGVEGRRMELQVKSVIGEIQHIIQQTFPKSIKIQTRLEQDLWSVMADPTQLHQVLLNLCVNARDAMPNGGVLTITAENVLLDSPQPNAARQTDPRPHVRIGVADTGAGIAPEIREKIFDPFFTTKEVGKGSGLGLSTTLGIVKSHGGFINVYSEPAVGTVFKVCLPSLAVANEAGLAAREERLPRGQGELVLLVDDESAVRSIAAQTLQTFGYKVITAGDGVEAMELYLRHSKEVAVILMDMMMPIMDGPATIHALCQRHQNLKVIAASGLSSEAHMAKAPSDAVKAFLPKPYTAETLLKTVHQVLAGKGS